MKKMLKHIAIRGTGQTLIALGLLFALALPSQAAFSNKSAGTSGAAFLKIGAGARPSAMGEAFTAVADDANTIFWNAGGLGVLEKNEFVALRADLFEGMSYNFFSFAYPTKSIGTFAVGFNNLNVSDIERRGGDTDSPDSTFSSNDTAYTLAYGKLLPLSIDGKLSAGLAAKFIRQTISDSASNAVAGDIGALYQAAKMPLSVGLAVQNFGSKAKFKDEGDPLPLTINTGIGYRFGDSWALSGYSGGETGLKKGLLVSLEGHFPRDKDGSARLGMEFTRLWSENLGTAFRGGYQSGRAQDYSSQSAGVSAGVGLTYKFFSFDFAWVPFGDLGNTYRYSVRLRF